MKPKPFVVLCILYLSLTLSFMTCCHDNITITRNHNQKRLCGSKQESKYHAHFCNNSLAVTKAETIPVTMYFVPTLSLDLQHFSKFLQLPVSGCNSVNHVSQSESRIRIVLQLDWMARFSLFQPDVSRTCKNSLHTQTVAPKFSLSQPTCSIQLIALHPLSCRL